MNWEKVLKKDKEQWAALSEVLLGEFSFERWSETPIPKELKSMKEAFDSLSNSDAQAAIKKMLEAGMTGSEKERVGMFRLIQTILQVES